MAKISDMIYDLLSYRTIKDNTFISPRTTKDLWHTFLTIFRFLTTENSYDLSLLGISSTISVGNRLYSFQHPCNIYLSVIFALMGVLKGVRWKLIDFKLRDSAIRYFFVLLPLSEIAIWLKCTSNLFWSALGRRGCRGVARVRGFKPVTDMFVVVLSLWRRGL